MWYMTTLPTREKHMHRIFTNDLERERLRQDAYARTPNRLSLNRHRPRRAGERQLIVILLIAVERQDRTIQRDARNRLNEVAGLEPGTRFDTLFELVESRRHSRAQRFGFASNRVLDYQVLDVTPECGVPLVDVASMTAASHGRLVAHA
jgi:hypothetical protein